MTDQTHPFDEPWMQTHSGRAWNLVSPKAADVHWPDVAHHMAQTNRFNGATAKPYSVAEHCCHVHDHLADQGHADYVLLLGLVHDAHEGFVNDLTTPTQAALDRMLPGAAQAFADLKARQDMAIFEAAGLLDLFAKPENVSQWAEAHRLVKAADHALLMQERNELLGMPPAPWGAYLESLTPAAQYLACWPPLVAKMEWLQRLKSYGVRVVDG